MIKLLLFSIGAMAGVGGISGGSIFFQDPSTYVEVDNRTLCQDGTHFWAQIPRCKGWDEGHKGTCIVDGRVTIFQPIDSRRLKCTAYRDGRCVEEMEVHFYQSPVRRIKVIDHNGIASDGGQYIIPDCDRLNH